MIRERLAAIAMLLLVLFYAPWWYAKRLLRNSGIVRKAGK